MSAEELKAALKAAGLDPVSHYTAFGVKESGVIVTPVPSGEGVGQQREGNGGGGGGNTALTLTTATGEQVTGTGADESLNALFDQGAPGNSTFNAGDVIDGAGGLDTLNVFFANATGTASSLPIGSSITSFERINLFLVDGVDNGGTAGGFFDARSYAGAEQLWQIDTDNTTDDFQDVIVTDAVTAGFRSTGDDASTRALADVQAPAGVESVSVALDGVGNTRLHFGGADVRTVTVTGSMADTVGVSLDLSPAWWSDVPPLERVNIGLSSAVSLWISEFNTPPTITTVDMSSSDGNISFNALGISHSLKTLIGGAGADQLRVNLQQGVAGATVSAGDGNDTVTLAGNYPGPYGARNNTASVELGAGADTLVAYAVTNVADAAEANFLAGLITVTDFDLAEGDTLNLSGRGQALTSSQLANAAAKDSLFEAVGYVAGQLVRGFVGLTVFSYGDDAYVYADMDGSKTLTANDGLVMLAGVDATQFSTDQTGGLVL
jgi:hypothetical protein